MSKPIRLTAIALALPFALSFALPSLAASDLGTVVITATRFPEPASDAFTNVSVITQSEIEHSPARSIPDLLKTIAGVDVRPLYGSMGIDAVVDIRGSGEAAGSNTLILVDGQRLNPVDMGSIKWETIPLAAIKQIEIIRGSASVLYGDRASAGVINIITDKSDKARASVRAEHGSFGYSAIDASTAGGKNGWYGSLYAHDAKTDGYRANSDAEQTSAGGRVSRHFAGGETFLDFSDYHERYGLPSALSLAQYQADPRQTTTPNYRTDDHGYRVRPGGTFKLGADLSVEIDGSYSDNRLNAQNADWLYRHNAKVTAQSLSPRLKWTRALAGAASSETTAGLDLYDGRAIGDDLDFVTGARLNRQTGQQQEQGLYIQNVSQWKNGIDTTIGLRRQHFKQRVSDEGANLQAQSSDDLTAWDLGAGYRFAGDWRAYRVYLKAARNFRLPNTDELFAYDPVTYQAIFNGALLPQTGHLIEGGLSWTAGRFMQQFTLFQQDNHNEIGYIADNGRNANLDPTRRRGAEWEGRWRLDRAWTLRGGLSAIQARFTEGPYSGKTIPLVPHHKETLGIQWDGERAGVHDLALVRVGSRTIGDDFANTYNKLGGYTTLDYQAQWNIKPYSVIFRAANLTDRKYAATGYSSAYNPGTYYPADPRSLSIALKADFF
ncbi:vitamin B12 transporter BtuB precursor [mine drainage metagenome]|uniref:Vitamin B12 transporter BtuB n=1 Tax=mine drainage metagenome TaxID=410659 RepID=A0A1J5RTI1_9ZZZZ